METCGWFPMPLRWLNSPQAVKKQWRFLRVWRFLPLPSMGTDGGVWVADQLGSTFQGEVSKYSASGQALFGIPILMPSHVSAGNWAGQ